MAGSESEDSRTCGTADFREHMARCLDAMYAKVAGWKDEHIDELNEAEVDRVYEAMLAMSDLEDVLSGPRPHGDAAGERL